MRRFPFALVPCVLLFTALAACESKPVHLYVLSALAEKAQPTTSAGVPLGVGPVTLPKYLDRPQIVGRIAANSLDQSEIEQWGGDLNDNIVRVLAANLGNLLATDRVSIYPWKGAAPIDYQVSMDVTRFEQDADGTVVLDVFWSIANPQKDSALVTRRTTYREPAASIASGGRLVYDAMIAAMNRELLALSRDIAAAMSGLTKP